MIVRILFWMALTWSVLQSAAWASDASADSFAASDVDAAVSLVQQSKLAAYRQALSRYDAAVKAAPADPAVAVARCEFMARFTDSESGDYIESSSDDQASCGEALAKTWSEAPAALLYAFEQDWSAEAKEQGEALLEDAAGWPSELRRRLASKLATQYDGVNNTRAGEMALMAARLGDGDQVPDAVRHLAKRGKTEQATALLHDAQPAEYGWDASRRVEAALELKDRQAALRELQRYDGRGLKIKSAIAADAELRAGRISDAQTRLRSEKGDSAELRAVRFRVAMAAKDWRAAAAEVKISDWDDFASNVGRFAVLATTAPSTLLSGPMLLVLLILLIAAAVLAAAPAVVVLPVHYRGLVRRIKGKLPSRLFDSVGLRHAWLAIAVFLIMPMATLGIVEPQSLGEMLAGTLPKSQALFRMMFWSTLAGMLVLSPLLSRFAREGGFGDARVLKAWWRVLLAWAGVMCVAISIAAWHRFMGNDTQTAQVEMVNSLINGGRTGWETLLAFVLVAVMAPLFEEFVFRGVILGGMARHISFGWSNVLQALLFALAHDDAPRFPFYLAVGLLAGWLVKSTRALSPAIALHMLVNAFAFAIAQQN